MPRLQGTNIFDSNGNCRVCAAPKKQHKKIPCGYPRKDDELRRPCEEICMHKIEDDGYLTCCSVCPHCALPPINDPNEGRAEGSSSRRYGG